MANEKSFRQLNICYSEIAISLDRGMPWPTLSHSPPFTPIPPSNNSSFSNFYFYSCFSSLHTHKTPLTPILSSL